MHVSVCVDTKRPSLSTRQSRGVSSIRETGGVIVRLVGKTSVRLNSFYHLETLSEFFLLTFGEVRSKTCTTDNFWDNTIDHWLLPPKKRSSLTHISKNTNPDTNPQHYVK